jgi:hypothetical protein
LIAFGAVNPSYVPKTEIQRTELPPIATSNAEIQDRLAKPDTLDERDARLNEKIDWKRQIEDTKRDKETLEESE